MSNWVDDIEWDNLLEDIRFGKCVLVVGPDLIKFDGYQTLFQMLTHELDQDAKCRASVDINPEYIFENEELLQLKPGKGDTSLYRFYREFYQRRIEFDEPFAKIAQMPFHTIISLLPDNRLQETFEKRHRPHQFGYYAPTDMPREVQKPDQNKPLLYNLLGTLSPPETVITFDHLFNYLQGILGARPLPVQLVETLKKAKSFLFLGVHFEKWYMQVMLRVFLPRETINGKISRYSLLRGGNNNEVCTFIARRLELDFLPIEPLDFLSELYNKVGEAGLLINPPKPTLATVFISYSHADADLAEKLADALKQANIKVIMDVESMPAGERIRWFMTKVLEVDTVVALVSEHSLRSPWVGKEIQYSIQKPINLVPCYLDKRFLDPEVVAAGQKLVHEKLREINDDIIERRNKDLYDSVSDLDEEEELWREFGQNLPRLIAEIKGRKAISLQPDLNDPGKWVVGVQEVLTAILTKR